jgi:uncharacterized Zn finger protein (UPF0148 family)
MEDCIICFCPFDKHEKKYNCVQKECKESICQECTCSFIEFSENSGIIPKCPAENCNGIFTMTDLQGIPTSSGGLSHTSSKEHCGIPTSSGGLSHASSKEHCGIPKKYLRLYASACFKYIVKDQGDAVKKRIQEAKVLADLRDERLKHLEKDYPKAISLIAKITFKNKLRALDKQKSKIVSAQVNKANRSCMSTVCNGFLDPNFICMTCGTEFCNKCEVKVLANHVCKQEDLDSVNIVNNMIKCPGCKLPVFKNEGCDSITCSNCGSNFKYSTGELGGHGSHNAKLQKTISIQQKEKLSNVLEKKLNKECLELLLVLEALEPKVVTKDTILTPLKKYYQDKDADMAGKRIAVKIDKYYNSMLDYRQFHKYLAKFEEKVRNDEDADILKNYLKEAIKELTGNN